MMEENKMAEHLPVLLKQSIEGLLIKPNGIYVDATFGRGGHSRAILNRLNEQGRLFAIDKDPEAIAHANHLFGKDRRFMILPGSFSQLSELASTQQIIGKIDGILLDLGVSSPQLDEAERGFSFTRKGPLDMRMDTTRGISAADFINQASVEEMADIFKRYGEERFARRIAKAIAVARQQQGIETTTALAEIIKAAHPKWEKHKHPATRVFQAIRIHVNNELADLSAVLEQAMDVMSSGGRLVVISFHSLEDRIVKQFMKKVAKGPEIPTEVPVKSTDIALRFKRIGKAMKPSEDEIQQNVRARSAVLRIGEKIR